MSLYLRVTDHIRILATSIKLELQKAWLLLFHMRQMLLQLKEPLLVSLVTFLCRSHLVLRLGRWLLLHEQSFCMEILLT